MGISALFRGLFSAYNSGMMSVVARRFLNFGFCFTLSLLLATGLLHAQEQHRGRKYTPPPQTAKITVTVTKATNGKPVENAAVVFHPMKDGKGEGNMELKTNEDGKVTIDVVPVGDSLRLQVIADGFQTFGDDYDIPDATKSIDIKLKRPARQYSIYEKHDDTLQGGAPEQKPAQPPADGAAKPQQN
jgi:hypothetical protein